MSQYKYKYCTVVSSLLAPGLSVWWLGLGWAGWGGVALPFLPVATIRLSSSDCHDGFMSHGEAKRLANALAGLPEPKLVKHLFLLRKQGTLNRWGDRAKAEVRHRHLQRESSTAVLTVESVAAAKKLAFHLQGNVDLSTRVAFAERQRNRRHPDVLKQLDRWWTAALRTAEENGRAMPSVSAIRKEDYLHVYRLLYVELVGSEEYDEAECDAEATDDWQRDSLDGETMERAQFLDSVRVFVVPCCGG